MTEGDRRDSRELELAALRQRVYVLEQALAEQAANPQTLVMRAVAQSASPLMIIDRDARIEYVNTAFEVLSGYTLSELRGKSPHVLRTGQTPQAGCAALWKALLAGKTWRGEMHNLTKSGEPYWVSVVISPVRDQDGVLTHFVALSQDITAQRDVEHKLRQSQAVARALMDTPGNIALVLAPDGTIVDCNTATAQLMGLARDDVIGSSVWDQMPALVAKRRRKWLSQILETAQPVQFEDPEGDLWFETIMYPVLDEAGNVHRVVVLARDITERKRNEHRLRASEARNRTMLEAIPDLIFLMSGDGDYLEIKESDAVPLIAPREQLIGRNVREAMPPEFADLALVRLRTALSTGETMAHEYSLPIDGELHDFEMRAMPIGPNEVFTIVRDITERRQAGQRTLELALERERVQMLTSFITDASHEFRTPLSIIGLKAYLLSANSTADRRDEYMQDITTQIEHLTMLIDSLLVMTRLESHAPLTLSTIDMPLFMSGLLENLQDDVNEAGLTLKVVRRGTVETLTGDAQHLRQALNHVFHNAVRFTPRDGTITMTIDLDDQPPGFLRVTVADDGVGIPADELPRIFDRFFRGDKVHSTRGFGLGLPIARAIIERHGGTISVESTVGQGSTFAIRLPLDGMPSGD